MTKVLAINGSPRKDGNTSILIRHIQKELEDKGIETEMVQLGGKKVHGCTACMKCFENQDRRCVIEDDPVNSLIEKMIGADEIILGSPVYFLDVTSEMKALIADVHIGRLVEPNEIAAMIGHCVENGALNATTIEITGGLCYPNGIAK